MDKLIAQRRLLTSKIGRISGFANSVSANESQNIISVQLDELSKTWEEFNNVQYQIAGKCKTDSTFEECEKHTIEVESQYYATKAELQNKLHSRRSSTDLNSSSRSETVSSPDIKLPKLNLPIFYGNILEWTSFYDLFVAAVHNNGNLSPAQKLYYLKSYLRGDAARVIASIQVSDANYTEAWVILKERYHNKRMIIKSHMKNLFNLPTLHQESPYGLRKLLDTAIEHVRSLKVLDQPTDHWDAVLEFLITEKLDSESKKQWELTGFKNELPTFKELQDFLEKRCRALESAQSNKKQVSATSYKFNQDTKTTATTYYSTHESASCGMCKSKDHYIYKCPAFLKATIEERTLICRRENLCFNCLRTNHNSQLCNSVKKCHQCNRKHHTLLHFDNSSSSKDGCMEVSNKKPTVSNCMTRDTVLFRQVILPTVLVNIRDGFGNYQPLRALLDSGSQASFITEAAVQRLHLERMHAKISIFGIGTTNSGTTRGLVQCKLRSRSSDFAVTVDALILSKITKNTPTTSVENMKWIPNGIVLADPYCHLSGHVDLLLSAEVTAQIYKTGKIVNDNGGLVAQDTVFGWIISGLDKHTENKNLDLVCHATVDEDQLLKRFWELEEIKNNYILSSEEKACEKHFKDTFIRQDSGRYMVKLPFRQDIPEHGNSLRTAVHRLRFMEKRLTRFPNVKGKYKEFLEEYESLEHMSRIYPNIQEEADSNVFYLPHHAVFRESSTTTKLRVVFDASAKSSNGISLNDRLMVGPKLQKNLMSLILRFRCYKIGFTADIAKMYRQILVHPTDRKFQRIVWQDNTENSLQIFELNTVTYGTASAPYLSTKVLQQLAYDEQNNYPLAWKILQNDFYMDDLMSGADSEDEALKTQSQLISLLKAGGMDLRKWSSNSEVLLEAIKPEYRETKLPLHISEDSVIKALGLFWHPNTDIFTFNVNIDNELKTLTKRQILSQISKLFDPLGWISPVIISGKIIIQKLWLTGLAWDNVVPENIGAEWLQIRNDLNQLSSIKLPRYISSSKTTIVKWYLHAFCDASESAYAAVIYLVSEDSLGHYHSQILCSKTKVAPIKTISLPRLELCGAVLLTRLVKYIMDSLTISFSSCFAWTDSTVVLSWLTGHPNRWKSFVANRVSEIHDILSPTRWYHLSTKDNPADCVSRGQMANVLVQNTLWWNRPIWLLDPNKWKNSEKLQAASIALQEVKRSVMTNLVVVESLSILHKYSSFSKLVRVTAYCLRFIRNCQTKNERKYLALDKKEYDQAKTYWLKIAQGDQFGDDITCLKNKQEVPVKSKIACLQPFLDENGLIRVGGRLANSDMSFQKIHPILLPRGHRLTKLIIIYEHNKHFHAGSQLLLNILRQRFWIIGGKNTVKFVIKTCVICCRFKGQVLKQRMGNLPKHRVEPARPFLRCGLDYGGPLLLRNRNGRGSRTTKSYIALFICFTTKAIHLELVSDLSTDAFLAALKRFISRRGLPSDIYSDNGTNFVGANNKLSEFYKFLRLQENQNQINSFTVEEGIRWHFIPPSSPHFGGLWEAGIKSTKTHLYRTIGNTSLTFEELNTILVQIEACLNSRPISTLSEDPEDILPLTPGHFLIGGPLRFLPEPNLEKLNISRLSRWQLIQKLLQTFWKRWSSEYLHILQQRSKWRSKEHNPEIGNIVLIKDENLAPTNWKIGRITEVHSGTDGLVRVVTVKTSNSFIRRPISRIVLLPVEN